MISVIIPAYNAEGTIAECLQSLVKQDYKKPYEIIVVDDGSTDNMPSEVKKFKKVKLIRQRRGGPAKARNSGAKAAKGSIMLFTDADCVADRKWITEMLKPFSRKGVVGAQGRYRTRQKGLIPAFVQAEIEQRYEKMAKAVYIDFVGSYSAAYRRKEFMEYHGFDESFPAASGEDPDLSFMLAKAGHKMVFNPNAIIYHKHPESLWKYLKSRYYRGFWGRLLYKKHPDKRSQASYKSKSFFYGIALTCMLGLLFLGTALLSLVFNGLVFISLVTLIVLIGIVLFESMYFMMTDKQFIIAGPIIVLLRNLSIGLGIIAGIIKIR